MVGNKECITVCKKFAAQLIKADPGRKRKNTRQAEKTRFRRILRSRIVGQEVGIIRYQRKADHMKLAVQQDLRPRNGLEDVILLHQSLPELNWQDIDLSLIYFNKRLSYPILINAMTGGTEKAGEINRHLAALARQHGFAMAVGSQAIAIDEPKWCDSFAVVREENPDGLIIANIAARESLAHAQKAIDMIQADAIQIHLNVPQELAMVEGDRNFRGILENVAVLAKNLSVPLIAKEVGFGLARESVLMLKEAGVNFFDIGGKGGTNFIQIEDQRGGNFRKELDDWGITTAVSLAEAVFFNAGIGIIASGGINSATQIAKALAMGADLCGMAGWFLHILWHEGWESLAEQTEHLLYCLKAVFLMTGSASLKALQKKPVIIVGPTAEYLRARAVDLDRWTQRFK